MIEPFPIWAGGKTGVQISRRASPSFGLGSDPTLLLDSPGRANESLYIEARKF
jgi:hypothetical protein